MVLLPGVSDALVALHEAGFWLVVVTNQPDVATGLQTREEVERMHAWMRQELQLDDIRVCCHVDSDGCACRKPRPGMLLEAAESQGLDLAASFMIGDRWRDIEAGHAAGCRTIYLANHYDERRPVNSWATVDSLHDASRLILSGAL